MYFRRRLVRAPSLANALFFLNVKKMYTVLQTKNLGNKIWRKKKQFVTNINK